MISHNNLVLLHLSLIEGAGVVAIHKIIRTLIKQQGLSSVLEFIAGDTNESSDIKKLDLDRCYSFTVTDWQQVGFPLPLATTIVQGLQDRTLLDKEIELLYKHKILLVTLLDTTYPSLLRHINMPPPLLSFRGVLDAQHDKRLAIIGSRLADTYAQQVIDMLVPALVSHEWEIVSGGARGADTMAHAATLKAGGKTIVVLGSGLLNVYPQENNVLFDSVVKSGGCVMSPFRLQAPPERHNFPIRNRIIAGLSQGCLVVQAAVKSGALITAEFALEQGRQVFAVPGSIFHPLSQGSHKLLGMGAKVVTQVSDIFEEFGDVADVAEQQTTIISTATKVVPVSIRPIFVESSDPVVRALTEQLTMDQLSVKTGMSLVDLQDKVFMLQLEGKVNQTFSGLWERVAS